MGEAKRRGTRKQRIEAAKRRIEELRPEFIICESCGEKLTNIDHIPMRDADAEALFAAQCPRCNFVTPHPCYTAAGAAKV